METARGTASHCQIATRVSGGSKGAVTTTYVALFRLGQRQVQFSSGSPLPISDGDPVIVAGRRWRGELYADAVRNVATSLTRRSSIFAPIIMTGILLVLAYFFTRTFEHDHPEVRWVLPALVIGMIYLLWRAVQIARAWFYVRSAAS